MAFRWVRVVISLNPRTPRRMGVSQRGAHRRRYELSGISVRELETIVSDFEARVSAT